MDWFLVVSILDLMADVAFTDTEVGEKMMKRWRTVQRVLQGAVRSQYQVERMLEILNKR